MKKFHDYLAESERTYNYRIKIAGDVPTGFVKDLGEKLKQFDVVKMSTAKTTPVQARLNDFPEIENDRVTHMDVEFRYPAVEPQIKQIAQLLMFDPNRIRMLTTPYEDSMDEETRKIQEQNQDLLADTDFPAPDKQQKALYKDYSTEYNNHAVLKNAYRSEYTVAGGPTPAAKTTNDLPMGNKSPMTTIKLPPKPPTGSKPRG